MYKIKVNLLMMLALFGMIAVLSVPANAWLGPDFWYGPPALGSVAAPVPLGVPGSGFFETESWTVGAGAATCGDSFFSGVASPFGGPFFGPCGFGPFDGIGGLLQSGLGGNIGAQNSATGTFTKSTAFGISPLNSLVFGVPIPGPGGFIFC